MKRITYICFVRLQFRFYKYENYTKIYLDMFYICPQNMDDLYILDIGNSFLTLLISSYDDLISYLITCHARVAHIQQVR